jgi:lysyl-tRNA synthetase class 2
MSAVMVVEQKSLEEVNWRPNATLENLRKRAAIIASIRTFFAERDVLEVDTPMMSRATITDPHVTGIPAVYKAYGAHAEERLYLQTSPEFCMKRLLAAGLGSIYQLNKAFRQGEVGHLHNPEFTMLEWYRLGFDHHDLMNEMDELLQLVLHCAPAQRISYADIFWDYLQVDAHCAGIEILAKAAQDKNIPLEGDLPNRDAWLTLLWTHYIEPKMGAERPMFLYDFPVSQASLAKIRPGNPPVASRFEVYYKGIELANGFHELQDSAEQAQRFATDLQVRELLGVPPMPIDKNLLAALQHGIPNCAGVALGIDRLIMLALNGKTIPDVLCFAFDRA